MDLALTPEQEMLKTAARRFVQQEFPKDELLRLAKLDRVAPSEAWDKLAATGWLGILIPEQYGGEGGSFTDAGALLEELGRGPVPGPHLSSAALGALTLLEGGTEAQKRDWLPRLAKGERRLVAAVTEADYSWDDAGVKLRADWDGYDYHLSGMKAYVFDAANASHFLCAARSPDGQQIGLLLVSANAPGVSVRRLPGFAWQLAEVKFDDVKVGESALLGGSFAGGWEALQRAILKTIPLLGAYQVGGSQALYEISVEYSRTRAQFGTPIGRFQRVQDHIIEMVNHLDAARWTTYEALWKLDTGRAIASSAHLSKAVSSLAYYEAANGGHEVHAGVASMTEYGLTLHTAASRTLLHYLGNPKYHRRKLADVLEL